MQISIIFRNFAAENAKKKFMSTAALQHVWSNILSYDLTTANKRWLAERLLEQVGAETSGNKVTPYTMAEINDMIDASEADFAAGRYYTMEESRRLRNEHLTKLVGA